LQIRDGDNDKSTLIALLCGTIEKLPELPYLSTHNYMWLKFTTVYSNNHKGFQANYSTIDIGTYVLLLKLIIKYDLFTIVFNV